MANLLEKMLRAPEEFLANLDKELEARRKGETATEEAVKRKEESLESERKRLDDLKGSKQQAAARFDDEIKRQSERIKSLEKEISEDRKRLKEGGKPGDQKDLSPAEAPNGKKPKAKKSGKQK